MSTWSVIILSAVGILIIVGLASWTVVHAARRLDAVHKQVARTRAQLSQALLRRAHAAREAAEFTDPGSELLVRGCVLELHEACHLIAIDSLTESAQPDPRAVHERWLCESNLSTVIRAVFDADTRARMNRSTASRAALEKLDAACDNVVITRTFHNTHVCAAREIRRQYAVLGRLVTGRTPPIITIDFDDDTQARTE